MKSQADLSTALPSSTTAAPSFGWWRVAQAAWSRPYDFITEHCRAARVDAFEVRLPLGKLVCMSGPDAARLFYDPDRFERSGAAPRALLATLFGERGVQTLDGDAHAERKALFLDITAPRRVAALVETIRAEWPLAVLRWSARPRITLYEAMHDLLGRSVCEWAGVPLSERTAQARIRDLTLLFDRAGALPFGHLRARRARARAEGWARRELSQIRRRGSAIGCENAAARIAGYERDGKLLDLPVAAVELLNVLRPAVAVSAYATLAAHALFEHPEWRAPFKRGDRAGMLCFVQEVRRYYPFFPALAARVRRSFRWRGCEFTAGSRVLLDVNGTNHDPRAWRDPERFDPNRFREPCDDSFAFIPQGGGDAATGHRCPGEGIAIAVTAAIVEQLVLRLEYALPEQRLAIDRSRVPALPRDRFVMERVALTL